MSNHNIPFDILKELVAEYEKLGKTQFLVQRGAIRVLPGGEWVVREYEGLKLALMDAVPGIQYETDIPYTFWKEVIRQMDYFIMKRDERAKAQAKATQPNE